MRKKRAHSKFVLCNSCLHNVSVYVADRKHKFPWMRCCFRCEIIGIFRPNANRIKKQLPAEGSCFLMRKTKKF